LQAEPIPEDDTPTLDDDTVVPVASGADVSVRIHSAGAAKPVASGAAVPVRIHPTGGAKPVAKCARSVRVADVPAPSVRKSVPVVSTLVVAATIRPTCGVQAEPIP
jgi:hypothetical protein